MQKYFIVLSTVFFVNLQSSANTNMCSALFFDKSSTQKVNLINYYRDKLKEIKDLDSSAPYAVALRALIMTKTRRISFIQVPLSQLKPIHPITREQAILKLDLRTKELVAANLLHQNGDLHLNNDLLATYLPSKNPMRVIQSDDGNYIMFDGNGRLFALKKAFAESQDRVSIEVQFYHLDSKLAKSILNRIRSMRKVL